MANFSTLFMSRLTHFCPELVDSIIDQLEDDPKTLGAAGLVGRAWYQRSRVLLFRNIIIGAKGDPHRRCKLLKNILAKRPHLSTLTRKVTVILGTTRFWDKAFWWPFKEEDILEVLELLSSLREVAIHGIEHGFYWSLLHPSVQNALYDLMSRRTVVFVSVGKIKGLDIARLAQCRQLVNLELHHVISSTKYSVLKEIIPLDMDIGTDPSSYRETKQSSGMLNVRGSGDAMVSLLHLSQVFKTLAPCFSPTTLVVANTNFDENILGSWFDFLVQCGSLVETYKVSDASKIVLPHGSLPNLRHFIVASPVYGAAHFLETLADELTRIVELDEPSQLTIIEFTFDEHKYHHADWLKKAIDTRYLWKRIDLLLQEPVFCSLREFRVALRAGDVEIKPWLALQPKLRQTMELTDSRGLLKFKVYRAV